MRNICGLAKAQRKPSTRRGPHHTVHKAQGMTVDKAHVLVSPGFDRHVSYVAMTRHKDEMGVHYTREEFGSDKQLDQQMGREGGQETALEAFHETGPHLLIKSQERSRKSTQRGQQELSKGTEVDKNCAFHGRRQERAKESRHELER